MTSSPWDKKPKPSNSDSNKSSRPWPKRPPFKPGGKNKVLEISSARMTAFSVLKKLDHMSAPGLSDLLTESQRIHPAPDRDYRLAREIAFGVARQFHTLHHVLKECMNNELPPNQKLFELALMMGIYQILFLDRVPDHASVGETVELAKMQPGATKLSGLANGVLRRVSREKDSWIEKLPELDWTIRNSVPVTARELLEPVFQNAEEQEAFWDASQIQAPLCIRLRGMTVEEFASEIAEPLELEFVPSEYLSDCLRFPDQSIGKMFRDPSFADGLWTVEDEGSQLAANLAAPVLQNTNGDGVILDMCAAPGGKCAHVADLYPAVKMVALDVSDKKLDRLNENLSRLNLTERVETGIEKEFWSEENNAERPTFDAVVVDAPCSGFGTLRRHPEIRYRRNAEDVMKLQKTQLSLLEKAVTVLKPGASLTFIVCTITKEETVDVVQQFQALHPELVPANDLPTEGVVIKTDETMRCPTTGGWRLMPHLHGCDGFFAFRWILKA